MKAPEELQPPALGPEDGLGMGTELCLRLEGAQLHLWAFLSTELLSAFPVPFPGAQGQGNALWTQGTAPTAAGHSTSRDR